MGGGLETTVGTGSVTVLSDLRDEGGVGGLSGKRWVRSFPKLFDSLYRDEETGGWSVSYSVRRTVGSPGW